MNDDELGRLLSGAFDAQARSQVGDHAVPPPPTFLQEPARDVASGRRRMTRLLAPLAAAAAVIAVVAVAAGINRGDDPHRTAGAPTTVRTSATSATPSQPASTAAAKPVTGTPVHVRLQQRDGVQVGVGMPVIAYFSRTITDARALSAATAVSVDGRAVSAAWYFEPSAAAPGYPLEGHLRMQGYWPAHSSVAVRITARGVSAGKGMSFDNDLSLGFSTGAAMIATVDDVKHRMTVTRDGARIATYPVSLGAAATPTRKGIKVVMEKGRTPVCLVGPNYHECNVKYTQRLTYDGEYLHAAPWNVKNIARGVDSSNGCTNLLPVDARILYSTFEVGDVVNYPNAKGPTMPLGAGYGDWNVQWATWLTGGAVRTS